MKQRKLTSIPPLVGALFVLIGVSTFILAVRLRHIPTVTHRIVRFSALLGFKPPTAPTSSPSPAGE